EGSISTTTGSSTPTSPSQGCFYRAPTPRGLYQSPQENHVACVLRPNPAVLFAPGPNLSFIHAFACFCALTQVPARKEKSLRAIPPSCAPAEVPARNSAALRAIRRSCAQGKVPARKPAAL